MLGFVGVPSINNGEEEIPGRSAVLKVDGRCIFRGCQPRVDTPKSHGVVRKAQVDSKQRTEDVVVSTIEMPLDDGRQEVERRDVSAPFLRPPIPCFAVPGLGNRKRQRWR
jgi:hypothetical protein